MSKYEHDWNRIYFAWVKVAIWKIFAIEYFTYVLYPLSMSLFILYINDRIFTRVESVEKNTKKIFLQNVFI